MGDLVIIFDGTGPFWDSTYSAAFENSFCRNTQDITHTEYYYRGAWGDDPGTFLSSWSQPLTFLPKLMSTVLGSVGTDQVSGRAVLWTGYEKLRGRADRIFLIGHSRGGAACIRFARMLDKTPIEAMFLFDAVNMTLWPDSSLEQIPDNVRMCFHAMRDPQLAADYMFMVDQAARELKTATNIVESLKEEGPRLFVATTEGEARAAEELPRARDRQRRAEAKLNALQQSLNYTRSNSRDRIYDWGNCAGRSNAGRGNFEYADFKGSHGALGGCPWPKDVFPNDHYIAMQVAEWMSKRMENAGLIKASGAKQLIERHLVKPR